MTRYAHCSVKALVFSHIPADASVSSLVFVQLSFFWTPNIGLYIYPCCILSQYIWPVISECLDLLGPSFRHQCFINSDFLKT